jgi:hypothetical protein
MGWLDGKGVVSNPKVKGSNLMGGVVCGQQWYVDRIFSYWIFIILNRCLGCFVKTTFSLALFFYYSLPLPPQTFISLHLHHSGKSLSLANKCVENRT